MLDNRASGFLYGAILISSDDLFRLRVAAAQWLTEHPDNPNAGSVRAALLATQPKAAENAG